MHTKSLRILTLGFIVVLLCATFPGQATQAQSPESAIHNDLRNNTQITLDISGQNIRQIQSEPTLNDTNNNLPGHLKLLPVTDRSQIEGTESDSSAMNWSPSTLSPRYWHAMAYDSVRGVTVLFGGFNGIDQDDTWEWDGTSWLRRDPIHRPSARSGHALAYDSARGVVVLFGGDSSGYQNDTWEWDGTDWIERNPPIKPGARWLHAMAYDSTRGVVVLFGGSNTTDYWDDTWEWDGVNWVKHSPISYPLARDGHAMAYDSIRARMVLFGGRTSSGVLNDTWEWDGIDWVKRTPVSNPPARREHAMAYDSTRGVVVLFGGCCYYNDTWEWNGTNWVQRSPVNSPSVRDGYALAYDITRGVVVLFGGYIGGRAHDTWEWNGINWVDRGTPNYPSARAQHAMAYDSTRGVTVLFSGGGGENKADTWEWDGISWSERNPPNYPSFRGGHSMAYDSVRGVVVLFGGHWSGELSDTWEWDGIDWVQRNPVHHPSARHFFAMVYDSDRKVIVLFGGVDASGNRFSDTWEWNGNDWVQRTPAHHPTAREQHAMAYDSARGVTVLFGGYDESWIDDETWEWNGIDWVQRFPASYPSYRCLHSMAYDSTRGVTVLFAGNFYNTLLGDTWEWDGTNWLQRNLAAHPQERDYFASVFDSERETVVIFGGAAIVGGYNDVLNDTWEYAPLVQHPILSPIDNPDGDGEYLIYWNTVTVAISYTLEEDDNSSYDSPSVRYQGDQTEFHVLGQGPGDWYYRVKASNALGASPWSNVELAGVRPVTPDLFPIANGDHDGIYLVDWSDATGATSYELQEDDNFDFTSPTVSYTGANSQYQVSGHEGGAWYYRVLASNAGGNSPWSNTESVGIFPNAPIFLPISNPDGNGDYLVDWNDVIGATNYRLEEDDNSAFTSPIVRYEGDISQYEVVSQEGGKWYYRVLAINIYGESPWSNIESVSVTPAAPLLLSISNPDGNGDYLVDWNVATGATAYELQEDDNSVFTSPLVRNTGSSSFYQVNGQQAGTWYYRVRASNAGGTSPWSNIESVGVIPNAPFLLPISNPDGNGDYFVDWNGVIGATSYRLEEDDNLAFMSPITRYEGDNFQYSIFGQLPGLWYYRVRATNAAGNSSWSNFQTVSVIPQAPILEPISNPDGNGDYLVNWNDVTGATSYYLEEDDNSEFTSPIVRYNGTNSQYQVNEQPTGLYYYRVRASCAGGDSLWSNLRSVSVAPVAPFLFSISNPDSNGDYLVDWSDVTGATSYRLEEDDNSGFTSPTVRYTGTNTQFHVYGQETGTWYYRVVAINAFGESPWSNTQSVHVGLWIFYLPILVFNH